MLYFVIELMMVMGIVCVDWFDSVLVSKNLFYVIWNVKIVVVVSFG